MTKEEIEIIERIFEKKLDQKLKPIQEKLERITTIEKRIEEILVDMSRAKLDIGFLKLNAKTQTNNMEIIKLDGEKTVTKLDNLSEDIHIVKKKLDKLANLPVDMQTLKKNGEEIVAFLQEMLDIIATDEEHKLLEKRVHFLESQ